MSPFRSSIAVVHARPFLPFMFIEQLPQMPSRHERRKVSDESCSLFILMSASSTIGPHFRSEEHTSELQSLMRISYAVFCLKKKKLVFWQQPLHQQLIPSEIIIDRTQDETKITN